MLAAWCFQRNKGIVTLRATYDTLHVEVSSMHVIRQRSPSVWRKNERRIVNDGGSDECCSKGGLELYEMLVEIY